MGASWINRFIFIGGVVNACREAKCTRVTYLSRGKNLIWNERRVSVYTLYTYIYRRDQTG